MDLNLRTTPTTPSSTPRSSRWWPDGPDDPCGWCRWPFVQFGLCGEKVCSSNRWGTPLHSLVATHKIKFSKFTQFLTHFFDQTNEKCGCTRWRQALQPCCQFRPAYGDSDELALSSNDEASVASSELASGELNPALSGRSTMSSSRSKGTRGETESFQSGVGW